MNQRGFAVIEIVLVLAVVAILGGVGFVAYNNFAAPKTTGNDSHSSANTDDYHAMSDMPTVSSTKDLDQAATSLDDPSFDIDGQSDIDSQSADFQ